MITTTTAAKPSFAFSYSKLKNFEICPRRHNELDNLKAWPEPRSEQLAFGDEVHLAMAAALKTGLPLDPVHAGYQPWIDKVNRTKGTLLVEEQCKWAITREFQPTAWFSKTVWLRTMADVVKLDDNVGLVIDWIKVHCCIPMPSQSGQTLAGHGSCAGSFRSG